MFKVSEIGIFNYKSFRRTGILACSSVLLLFLLGGLVRVTGSGMGCPDWPKCFGLWAPPTCECQLPPNYQDVFLEKRIRKVERFAAVLEKLGFAEKAQKIRSDKTILIPEEFNATKAWIEYINRVFGVLAGLFSLGFFAIAFLGKYAAKIRVYALLGLIMLLVNAWLGSIVVATNLLPGLVSLHFMLSFACVFFFMLALHGVKAFESKTKEPRSKYLWLLLLVLILVEVLLGTFAREMVEFKTSNSTLKLNGMLDFLGMGPSFIYHRFLPALIFAIAALLAWKYRNEDRFLGKQLATIAVISLIQICFGALNIVFVLPAYSQILHIVVGSLMPVIVFYYLLASNKKEVVL